MPKPVPALLPSEPDPTILARLNWFEHACLMILALLAAANILWWLIPALNRILPSDWQPMDAESMAAILLGALSLMYSDAGQSRWKQRLSVPLAAAVTDPRYGSAPGAAVRSPSASPGDRPIPPTR